MTESSQTALSGNQIDTSFDVNALRARFPILAKRIRGNPFIYLDNAATTQKPQSVIDVLNEYYTDQNANIHRGIHYLSEQATEAYEEARCRVAKFINAPSERQVIFVRAPPRASTWWRKPSGGSASVPATKFSFPPSSTIPTSFPGNWWRKP